MKAIVVFDVNEFTYEAIDDYFTGVITLHMGNDGFIDFQNALLQPMPEKKHNNGGYRVIDGTEWWYDSEHDDGWNDCIDEILGEEE